MSSEQGSTEPEFADFVITTMDTSETLAGHAVETPSSDNGTSVWK